MLCDVVVVVIVERTAPVIYAASHLDHKKELHGLLFLCIHVVLFL